MRVRFRVHGRVQGVGFRWHTAEEAQALGLAGWVGNAWDGTVEGEAEGDPALMERFRKALQEGTSMASVSGLDWDAANGGQSLPLPFDIR